MRASNPATVLFVTRRVCADSRHLPIIGTPNAVFPRSRPATLPLDDVRAELWFSKVPQPCADAGLREPCSGFDLGQRSPVGREHVIPHGVELPTETFAVEFRIECRSAEALRHSQQR